MITFINDIFLYLNYSFTFAVSIFSFIFWVRTKDKYLSLSLWIIQSTLYFQTLIIVHKYFNLYFRAFQVNIVDNEQQIIFGSLISALIYLCLIGLILFSCARYFLYHLKLNKRESQIAYGVVYTIIFLSITISILVINQVLPQNYWINMSHIVGYEIFPFNCLMIGTISLYAWFYRKKCVDKHKRAELLNIIKSFTLFLPGAVLDLTLLWNSNIRISFYALIPFFIHLFLHISRYYYQNYEQKPDKTTISIKMDELDFSPREKDIAKLLVEGINYGEVAESLYISVNTVKTHVKSIYKKAGVSNKLQLSHTLNNK